MESRAVVLQSAFIKSYRQLMGMREDWQQRDQLGGCSSYQVRENNGNNNHGGGGRSEGTHETSNYRKKKTGIDD